jgi:predicted metal-dependent HD superfamily phosphohydrolase
MEQLILKDLLASFGQPISQAKKNETILAWGNGFLPQLAYWHKDFQKWVSSSWHGSSEFNPSLFIPMPQQPNFYTEWLNLMQEMSCPRYPELLHALYTKYNEPHRFYHNTRHIEEGLRFLRRSTADVRMAWFFHDVIYNPLSKDNEEQSAQWFEEVSRSMNLAFVFKEEVKRLILQTKHHSPDLLDIKAVQICQADLEVLYLLPKDYHAYYTNVRKEYLKTGVTLPEWTLGRRAFLKSWLRKGQIYPGEYHSGIEELIRTNMKEELASIEHHLVVIVQ